MGDGASRGLLSWMNQETDCPECRKLQGYLRDAQTPWNSPHLKSWSIVGMNHYKVGGVRHLFVAMNRDGRLIKAEGPVATFDDEIKVWQQLDCLARTGASRGRDHEFCN